MIILEFLGVLSLGGLLFFYTCRCVISLMNERRSPDAKKDIGLGIQTSGEQVVRFCVGLPLSNCAFCNSMLCPFIYMC